MPKIKTLFLLLILVFFFLPKTSFAEEIQLFEQNIKIQQNSDVIIEETIVYDFGEQQRRGIYRYIPHKYETQEGLVKTGIVFLGVTDQDGNKYNYETGREGNNVYIKIGDADIFVSGTKTYKITYKAYGIINFFENHDEFYWNVTGNQWKIPIKKATANVFLQDEIQEDQLKLACYTGSYGSKEALCSTEVLSEKGVKFETKEFLFPGQGLTIVIGFSKGLITEPTAIQKITKFLFNNFLIFFAPILFFVFLSLWKRGGRDPEGRGTIIAEYEPPKGVVPAQAQAVVKESVDNKGITATIIDLARRGYFTIKEIEKKGILKSKDWELLKKENGPKEAEEYEKKFMDDLFSGANSKKLSELKKDTSLPSDIQNFQSKVMDRVVEKGYFPQKPSKVVMSFILKWDLFLLGLLILSIFLGRFTGWNILSLVVSFILVIIFGRAMPHRTREGKEIQEKLLGFKEFLSVTEKDRVKFHFSPSAHPEKFAQYLPYAIIFGVEKEWANVFKGIEVPRPDWYQGTWAGGYTAFLMADSLSSFNSSFNSSISSARSSAAASGSSGFGSGGGFSGGGFGGGGGGSW